MLTKTIIILIMAAFPASLIAQSANEIIKKHTKDAAANLEEYLQKNPKASDKEEAINYLIESYARLEGFKIAMRDLEIRGAGNLLGTQQSGHISAIGFELYCKLLKQSVERLNGNTDATRAECSLYLDFINTNEADHFQSKEKSLPAFIPSSYLEETDGWKSI